MYDIATAYNKYKFLGNDFLTWIWYAVENSIDIKDLTGFDCTSLTLYIGNGIVLENIQNRIREKITIKGDEIGLEEGKTALRKGAFVTDINLLLKIDDHEFSFTVKGESINITSLKTASFKSGKTDDIEASVLDKAFLFEKLFAFIDTFFNTYIGLRSSEKWENTDKVRLDKWIRS